MKTVYLAGPITGLNFEGCTEWRDAVVADLAQSGIKGLSPMRGKDYLRHLDVISADPKQYEHLNVLSSGKGIITRDRFDCTRCDVLLVNLLGYPKVSIGTVMEIAWADLKRIPIVCAMEDQGNPHEHMMVKEAINYRVPTLEEAVHIVKAILM